MNGVYIGAGRMLVSTCYGGALLVPSNDFSMMPSLVATGAHEIHLTRFFAATIRPGQTIVDVGAHVGYFTILFAMGVGPTGRVIAYEPHPDLQPFLVDNLSINSLLGRTTVHALAAHSEPGRIKLHASRRFHGNSSVNAHPPEYFLEYRDSIDAVVVDAEPLGPTIERLGFVDILKMDIEGGEFHALRGCREHLLAGRVGELVFEYNREMLQEEHDPFCTQLRELEAAGFTFGSLNEEGALVGSPLSPLLAAGSSPHLIARSPIPPPGRALVSGSTSVASPGTSGTTRFNARDRARGPSALKPSLARS